MILRRITEHVKAQNWFAVGIDFVIVVIGVFVGIQVSNWNDVRQDKTNEARYLVELTKDLESDIAEMDETIAAARKRVTAAEYLFNRLDIDYEIYSSWRSTVPELRSASKHEGTRLNDDLASVRVMDGNGHTFDELVTTGNLGILSDRNLVKALNRYYSAFTAQQDGDAINRHLQLRFLDYLSDKGLSRHEPISPDQLTTLIVNDPAFLGHVKIARDYGMWQMSRWARTKTMAQETLELIEDNTGK